MKGFVKTFLLIFFVIAAAILFMIWRERRDFTNFAVEVDGAVNEILLSNGVRDTDIIQQYRQEKKSGKRRWIEVTREVDLTGLPGGNKFPQIKSEILKTANKSGLTVSKQEIKRGKSVLTFSKDGMVLLRLILHFKVQVVVALVMDDLGYEDKKIYDYMALDIPITYSILPKEKYTRSLVKILSENKKLYMMHQPMEPEHMELKINYPGKAALLLKMSDEENKKMLEENLKWVPGVYGINNHMGSEFTKHYDRMKYIAGVLKQKGLIFFDSSTSRKAVGKRVSDDIGVPASYNNVFLDIEDNPEIIHKQLVTLLATAKKRGRAAAICHITKKHLLENLKEMIPVFRKNGVEFVDLKEYIESQ